MSKLKRCNIFFRRITYLLYIGGSISNMRSLSLVRATGKSFQLLKPIPVNFFSKNRNVSSSETAPKEEIEGLVKKSKVVVFMKGLPQEPSCGFSNAVVQILRMHGVEFDAYDVLDKNPLRQGVKDYTGWPTIPQIFINGEFIGGCDILLKMHQTGELVKTLAQVGIQSKATGKPEEVKAK